MNRKHIWVLVGTVAFVAIVAITVAIGFVASPSSHVARQTVPPSVSVTIPRTTFPTTEVPPSTTTTTIVVPPSTSVTETTPTTTTCAPDAIVPACWNTEPDTGGTALKPGDTTTVDGLTVYGNTGAAYNTVVIKLDGLAHAKFDARYVTSVSQDGSGKPVSVQGSSVLKLVVYAPAGVDAFGQQPLFQSLPASKMALREIKYAGSFEGQTTFAIGLDHRVRFAVMSDSAQDGTAQIVLYVASS